MENENQNFPSHLNNLLLKRKEQQLFRKLSTSKNLIDFCSNDYLGFNKSTHLKQLTEENLKLFGNQNGSGGSRLLAGNLEEIQQLEKEIADFHFADAGLIFNSGYDANLGLLSSIGKKDDVFLYDELVHASIHDGIRLSNSKYYKFKHNDVNDLKRLLQKFSSDTNVFLVVESVYSMDGDLSPLKDIVELKKQFPFFLIVDEAHSTGIFGNKGRGLCNELNIQKDCFARIHTFGKALGVHGAIVLGNQLLIDYLVNYARSFIYTTALSPHAYAAIKSAYQLLEKTEEINLLKTNIDFFNEIGNEINQLFCTPSAIQTFEIAGNENAEKLSSFFINEGFDIRCIKSPTVKFGTERLRICLHSFNTKDQIKNVINLLKAQVFS
jgi:8-amino-7-oxononanoate synthase